MPKNKQKSTTPENPQTRDINAAQRVSLAVKLRTQKVKYADIAVKCGYGSAQAAHKAVQREMQRVVVTNIEELRREELNFLDDLQQKCYAKIIGNDEETKKGMLWAVDRLIAISDRRSKLMGLDVKPDEQAAAQHYVKKIMIVNAPANAAEVQA